MSKGYYCRLTVSYDFSHFSAAADAAVEQAVGLNADGSGAGFGARDLEFTFDRRRDLTMARTRLAKATLGFPVSWVSTAYVRT